MARRKPNETIRIQGRDYGIYVVSPRVMKRIAKEDCAGMCDMHTRQIFLVPSVDIKQTLLHELVEIANYELELGLNHPQIKAFENFWMQVLSDNVLTFHD